MYKSTLFRIFLICLIILCPKPESIFAQSIQTEADRPNIIYILLDDVGFADLGPYGSEICTPSIDMLAKEGIRYNRFETRAICSPTRAALLMLSI